jgi:hypothetical protein
MGGSDGKRDRTPRQTIFRRSYSKLGRCLSAHLHAHPLGLIFGTVIIGINVGIAESVAFAVFFIGGLFALWLAAMVLVMLWTDFIGTISKLAIAAFYSVIFLAACKIVFGSLGCQRRASVSISSRKRSGVPPLAAQSTISPFSGKPGSSSTRAKTLRVGAIRLRREHRGRICHYRAG